MKGFVFKLEPVLSMRKREEQRRQKVLAGVLREQSALESAYRQAQELAITEEGDLRDRLAGGVVDLRGARTQGNAIVHARSRARLVALKLAGVMQQAERARRSLAEAVAQRRAVELLREKQYEAWRAGVQAAERAELDEIAARARPEFGTDESAAFDAGGRH